MGYIELSPPLNQPGSVAEASDPLDEKIYIADTGNNRVVLVRLPADTPVAVWEAMKQRLLASPVDVAGAVGYFSASTSEAYRWQFLTMTPTELTDSISQILAITPVFLRTRMAQYRFDQISQGLTITFPINFARENGLWKIVDY